MSVRMGAVGPRRVRAVTHLDVDADGIQTALNALELVLPQMKLEGIHHITAITGDAPRNVDFYVRVLGSAAGQEVGQPGRPDRLPPLLRRRERARRART